MNKGKAVDGGAVVEIENFDDVVVFDEICIWFVVVLFDLFLFLFFFWFWFCMYYAFDNDFVDEFVFIFLL